MQFSSFFATAAARAARAALCQEYPWGTMHFTGRVNLKEMKITGSFQAMETSTDFHET
jgi:hypothetical protein